VTKSTAPAIQPGDVIAFLGNRWNLGHASIMCAQRYNGGDDDTLWRAVHVGFVAEYTEGKLILIEFTMHGFLTGGMVITPLKERLDGYKFGILHLPLDHESRESFSCGKLNSWIDKHMHDGYNILGLPFAVMRWFKGIRFAGKWFCSEAVRAALSHAGAWNGDQRTIQYKNGLPRTVTARIEPQRYSPWDIVRARCFHQWELIA